MCEVRIHYPAPNFSSMGFVNGQFQNLTLQDYRGKYIALLFYNGDFLNACPAELIAFSDRATEFREVGCQIIACSTDSHFAHEAWTQWQPRFGGLGEIDIALLGDKSTEIARQYGVLLETGHSERALFIIDRNGLVRQITINDSKVRLSVDEALRLIHAFQFTDEFGLKCPPQTKSNKSSFS
ncbi:peroxiredoxin 1-like [Scaptodrosophila lebanonensis]|uniref:thioredoxin-dependent peroxiredoxin n=1 Tax=Drosophila lebanonensis TaxID=7225 RepID=A0A6J2U6R2_DROLE|nr:peroxiredoxin 1-like [Scaptodrosophila lebanonensis]